MNDKYDIRYDPLRKRLKQQAEIIERLTAELAAVKAAAYAFAHAWRNEEVNEDDPAWPHIMAGLEAKADAVMRLCKPDEEK